MQGKVILWEVSDFLECMFKKAYLAILESISMAIATQCKNYAWIVNL